MFGVHNFILHFFFSPLEQFYLLKIFSLDFFLFSLDFYNFFFYFYFFIFIFIFIFIFYLNSNFNFFNMWKSMFNNFFYFIYSNFCFNSNLCNFFMPFFLFLFLFILILNFLSMFPYSFTITSHIFFSFFIAIYYFFWINLLFFFRNFLKLFSMFVPSGVPISILHGIILIEFISYFSRPISLSVRLFANMMAGHTLTYILSSFFFLSFSLNFIIIFFPSLIICLITFMEIGVSYLQAYVFVILCSLYLRDTSIF